MSLNHRALTVAIYIWFIIRIAIECVMAILLKCLTYVLISYCIHDNYLLKAMK